MSVCGRGVPLHPVSFVMPHPYLALPSRAGILVQLCPGNPRPATALWAPEAADLTQPWKRSTDAFCFFYPVLFLVAAGLGAASWPLPPSEVVALLSWGSSHLLYIIDQGIIPPFMLCQCYAVIANNFMWTPAKATKRVATCLAQEGKHTQVRAN